MTKQYHQPGHEGVTSAVDKLQQEVGVACRGRACALGLSLAARAQLLALLAVVPLLRQQQLPGLA